LVLAVFNEAAILIGVQTSLFFIIIVHYNMEKRKSRRKRSVRPCFPAVRKPLLYELWSICFRGLQIFLLFSFAVRRRNQDGSGNNRKTAVFCCFYLQLGNL